MPGGVAKLIDVTVRNAAANRSELLSQPSHGALYKEQSRVLPPTYSAVFF